MTGLVIDAPTQLAVAAPVGSPRRRRRRHDRAWLLGLAVLVPLTAAAVLLPVLPLPDPTTPSPRESMQAPSLTHLLGTDRLGRDLLSRVLAGARVSLMVGAVSAVASVVIGMIIGTVAGFSRRAVDSGVMAVNNVFLSFPSLLLAIAMVAVFGAGVWQVVLAIVIGDAPQAVRMQRSMVLSLKSRPYMDAARMAAAPSWWLLLRHVVPNTLAPMVVLTSIYAASAIVTESALSFLGLGVVPPTPSWGNIMADGRPYLQEAWWISAFPGIAIVVVSIALHLLSDGLRLRLRVVR